MRKHSKADHTENGFTENCKKESTLEKEQPDFIREKIVRKNSIREEILSFGGKPALCGAIFGLTAAFIFAVFLPFFEAFGFGDEKPKETETAQIESETEPAQAAMPQNRQELTEFIAGIVKADNTDEEAFYDSVRQTVESLQNSMVTVTALKKDVDWFDVSYDSQYVQSGLLLRKTLKAFYVLTGYTNIRQADSIQVEFADGSTEAAELEGYDSVYGIAVLSISRDSLSERTERQLRTVQIGSTALLGQGTPVFVIGSPSGSAGSVGIGFVSFINEQLALTDCVIRGVQSSIQINGGGCSFLMGLNGQILGVFTSQEQNIATGYSQAYSIDDLVTYIRRIYSGKKTAGIGITGQDIDRDIRENNKIPSGVYITDVKKGSAAYKNGVQAGDVLGELNGQEVTSMEDYEALMLELTPGEEIKMVVYRNSKGAYKKMELNITPTVRQG
ncbi:MAG: PDZ domain-containing protein [Lachnospiraceae bacterium]|nr:PDZ domain-containing protein [Lachnospiraceae bacterium]